MERVPIRLGRLRTAVAPSPARDVRVYGDGVAAETERPLLAPASAARVCRVCALKAARYTCPRCNAPYCSVACYKEHGEACTERFFEAHVRSEMQLESNEAGGGTKGEQQRRTAAMLERVRQFQQQHDRELQGEAQDEDEGERLAERMLELALLDEQGELSLDALTEDERAQFLNEVADGRLGKFVSLWSPWWLLDERTYRRETSARRRALIMEEIGSNDDEKSEEEADLEDAEASGGVVLIQPEHAFPAAILTDQEAKQVPRDWVAVLPSGRSPSPTLRFHLVEVLFAYAFVLRAFNGDYSQDVADAVSTLLHQSAVLRADARYGSLEHVLVSCLEQQAVGTSRDGLERVAIEDATKLVRVPVFALDALRDAQAMVSVYNQELAAGEKSSESKAERKERRKVAKQLAAVEKKLEFFIMWVMLADRDELQVLGTELELAVASMNPPAEY